MSFWTSETLKQRAPKEKLIAPYSEDRVKHGAYELSLGDEAFITSDEQQKKQPLADGVQLVIPPGQFGLLITKEVIQIPADAMGFISIKAGIKFSGLVNVSGFHVDPGFSGKLKFSVYNAGSQHINLTSGQEVFLIWFSGLDSATTDLYSGDHKNQQKISSQDVMRIQGEVHSPAALDKRLTDVEKTLDKRLTILESNYSTIKTLAIGIASGLAIAIVVFLANHFWDIARVKTSTPSTGNPTAPNVENKDPAGTSSSIAPPSLMPETSPKSTIEMKSQSSSSIPVKEQNKVDGGTQKSEGSQESKNVSPEQGGKAQDTKDNPKPTTHPGN